MATEVPRATITLLLAGQNTDPNGFREILAKYSSQLKTQFENRNLWLRYALTLILTNEPKSALHAFSECMRIDQDDPLPAMLAAKILLEHLNDPEKGLDIAREAIQRCQRHEISSSSAPLLSKCYLLASVMHAQIYERKPESIRNLETTMLETTNLQKSQQYLNLALETHNKDCLIYFHKALHEARNRTFPAAIDNLREAIKLNRNHLPSMQLLILSLSALERLDEALVLCESTLREYEDNLFLLYIKCNLEERLVGTRGYRAALCTAQHMIKCIRRSTMTSCESSDGGTASTATLVASHPNGVTSGTTTNAITNTAASVVEALPLAGHEAKQSVNLFADSSNDGIIFRRAPSEILFGELTVWLLAAEIFIKIGAVEDAELCVDEGSSYADGMLSHCIMYVRGLIAKTKNNLVEAKTFFQSCLALCPRHARALQQIAHVHYLLGNLSTAEKFLRDSLDIDRTNSKSWDYLRLIHIEQNQHEKAKNCEREFEALEGKSPVVPIDLISRLILN